MAGPHSMGEFEQLVLLSVLRLGREAYGMAIRQLLQEDGGRSVTRGALYKTLERLAEKGMLEWEVSESTPERGGLPRRRFRVTADGVAALRHSRETLERFWSELEGQLG